MKLHLKREIAMKLIQSLTLLSLNALRCACAAVKGGTDVDDGRNALLAGNYKAAVGYFQEAENADPNFMYGTEQREGVASYLGRSQYLTGDYAQARQNLEKALSRHKSDNLARLYLGLTLYRLGDQKAALTNIERGMKGIASWLNYLETNFAQEFGQSWDPGGTIRASIKTDLAMISSGKVDWPKLIAAGERLGIQVEQQEQIVRVQSAGGRP